MNTELQEKVRKYKEKLELELKELKDERKALLDKVANGESLTRKENKRNHELVTLISDLEEDLKPFKDLEVYEEMKNSVITLGNTKTTKTTKEKLLKKLLTQFKKLSKFDESEFLAQTGLEKKDLSNLDDAISKCMDEYSDLEAELRVAKRKGWDTQDIEDEMAEKKQLIEMFNTYKVNKLDITEIEKALKAIADPATSKEDKQYLVTKTNTKINVYEEMALEDASALIIEPTMNSDEQIDEVDEVVDEELEKKSFKEKVKEKLTKVGDALKKNGKKIAAIGGVVILTIAIVAAAKSCSKDIEKTDNKNDDLDNKTSIEQIYENANKETIDALTTKGYNEYMAVLMAENFSKDTIDALLAIPYNELIENYATEKEFNIDYLNDYENARTIYELTSDKAVDYVNRSYKIQETGFYDEATINNIVEVVMAIDNKELFTQDNANLAQSFNTSFNRIVDNYLFGTTTDEDIKKIDALEYFAAEDTDLDKFLTEFSTLAKANIENKDDAEVKEKMYNYIATFALSLNGYTNTDEDIKVSKPYNTNAQVNDYFDWYMAYNSFIAPLYPTMVDESDFTKYEELQYLMITALQDPQFEIICGESRTLGGE